MKKIILIFSALLSVLALNSCKDDETTDNSTTSNICNISIAELKSYVGQTYLTVVPFIESKGFYFDEEESKFLSCKEGTILYLYKSNKSSSKIQMETCNGVVYDATIFLEYNTDREKGLYQYSKWSSESINLIDATTYDYYSSIGDVNYNSSHYENHDSFLLAYNQFKDNMTSCYEKWSPKNNYYIDLTLRFHCDSKDQDVEASYEDNTFAPNYNKNKDILHNNN